MKKTMDSPAKKVGSLKVRSGNRTHTLKVYVLADSSIAFAPRDIVGVVSSGSLYYSGEERYTSPEVKKARRKALVKSKREDQPIGKFMVPAKCVKGFVSNNIPKQHRTIDAIDAVRNIEDALRNSKFGNLPVVKKIRSKAEASQAKPMAADLAALVPADDVKLAIEAEQAKDEAMMTKKPGFIRRLFGIFA